MRPSSPSTGDRVLAFLVAQARKHPMRFVRRCGLVVVLVSFVIVVLMTLASFGTDTTSGATPQATRAAESPAAPARASDSPSASTPAHPGPSAPATPAATAPDAATIAAWWKQVGLGDDCAGPLAPVDGAAVQGTRRVGGCATSVETSFSGLQAGSRHGAAVFDKTGVKACQDPYLTTQVLVGLHGATHMLVEGATGWWLVDRDSVVVAFTGSEGATPAWPIASPCLKG